MLSSRRVYKGTSPTQSSFFFFDLVSMSNLSECTSTKMGYRYFLLVFTTVLTLTFQSDGQLTFNPNAKSGDDWSLAGHKRSNEGDYESLQLNFHQPWQQRHQRSKADGNSLLEVLLKKLIKMSEERSTYPNDQNYMLLSSPPLEMREDENSGTVSKSTTDFPETKFREY